LKTWPKDTAATDKHYGARENLQQTAAFIEEPGLTISAIQEEDLEEF
jgi:hypothetical protein